MECNIDKYLLYEYMDKTIDPLERIFLEQHLKTCTGCRKDLTQMKLLLWEMDEIKESEMEVPSDIYKTREAALSEVFVESDN
jgi:predicted anti-sigma-YlaC factor YlaD